MKNTTLSGSLPKQNVFSNFLETNKSSIIEFISALFILLFAYTAIDKLRDLNFFRISLRRSPLKIYTEVIVWSIPVFELIISLLLFLPKTRKLGLYLALVTMSAFTLYVGYMIVFLSDLPCSCGGVIQQMNWKQHLIFNTFFTLLAVSGIKLINYRSKI